MISVYVKSGSIQGHNAVSFILKSQKHKWVKAHKYHGNLSSNSFTKSIELESIGIMYAIKHIKDRYKKKKITIYIDSQNMISSLKRKNGNFEKNTNNSKLEKLRDMICTFNNIHIKNFNTSCEYKKELEHILTECALDSIEIDEKE